VAHESAKAAYSKAVVRMPRSYLVTDDRRAIGVAPSRADLALPEDGFVYCCFNDSYKIAPREFDIWVRLLRQTEGSVLWVLSANRWAETALRAEA